MTEQNYTDPGQNTVTLQGATLEEQLASALEQIEHLQAELLDLKTRINLMQGGVSLGDG